MSETIYVSWWWVVALAFAFGVALGAVAFQAWVVYLSVSAAFSLVA